MGQPPGTEGGINLSQQVVLADHVGEARRPQTVGKRPRRLALEEAWPVAGHGISPAARR